MDRERADRARLYPDEVRVAADLYGSIAAGRRENLERVVAQARARGREPQVCLYALSIDGQVPRASLDAAANYAERQSWHVGPKQSYTDPNGATAPKGRPGWGLLREQIRAGFAEGVVVITAAVVSCRIDDYRRELGWFEEHRRFVALVASEIIRGRA
ncbi:MULTISPECIES: hypothetical protein [unclassified Streptomyces]|uniref:hypothetical protein n=1 Tax=unclassified Streptomyces TaxID=2593676 RepID=UPI001F52A8D9|nr:hypothetical protein [Streptomyces sp. TSRI0281]